MEYNPKNDPGCKYTVIMADNIKDLGHEVSSYLFSGWELYGDLQTVSNNGILFLQAVQNKYKYK